jgi:hypothetical protein
VHKEAVLILGNGISRAGFTRAIEEWPGELWACNYAFREFGGKLTRLTGHLEVLAEARRYRREHGLSFQLWGGNLGAGQQQLVDHVFSCPREFWKDSGTTLVAQALQEGRLVSCCGFDLGGLDMLSPGLENQDKSCWVRRWRELARHYGLATVTFWGHDHRPFILGNRPAYTYMRLYRAGKPHLGDPAYLAEWSRRTGLDAAAPIDEDRLVRVGFLRGPARGREQRVRYGVAAKLVERGEAQLLTED